jgi:lipoyl(octanoyl) transferase
MKNKQVKYQDWGLLDYQQAWDRQDQIFADTVMAKTQNRNNNTTLPVKNHLFFVEHPHVYTLGKSGKFENLLLDEAGLADKNATYYKINRGGDITYHGPGQIVAYPILDLADYGIKSERYEGYTGVWLDAKNKRARKICALGVRCSRWVTMHGLAFNVNTDLSYFKNIVPCGIDDKDVTSMERELGFKPDIEEVKQKLKRHIGELFEMEIFDS